MVTTRPEIIEDEPGGHRNPGDRGPAPEAVRKQAEKMLAHPLFQKSQRYCNLLRYIVDRTLKGQTQDLKERIIGIEVFGRSNDYDTSLDPTVRVAAAELRKRLVKYYSLPEHEGELRIEVPVRSYVAEFKLPERELLTSPAQKLQEPQPATGGLANVRWYIWGPAAAVAVALAVWAALRLFSPQPAVDRFWAPVLKSSGPVLICISSRPDGHTVPGMETSSPSPSPGAIPAWQYSGQRVDVTVGMIDVSAANDLTSYLRRKGKESNIRPWQATTLNDLRSQPAVLYGSFSNEWSKRLEGNLHFRFDRKSDIGLRWIEDSGDPGNRKWSIDFSTPYEQISDDYALITRVEDQTTGQWLIGIGALTGLGTFTANEIMIDPKAMSNIASSLPSDWEHKNLQIVLQIKVVQGSAGATRVVGVYTW